MTGPGPARLQFWGVRGSIPAPGPTTARYGGNTSCVTVDSGTGPLVVFDAGTGIRPLGVALSAQQGPLEVEILVSHTHWDHIQGLPFFSPLYRTGTRVRIRGPRPTGASFRAVIEGLLAPAVFPIPVTAFQAEVGFGEIGEDRFEAGDWTVRSLRLCHPGPTLGYRLESRKTVALAYVTDNELPGGLHGVGPDWRARLVDFLGGVHTLVHDATNAEEQIAPRRGWGHSSPGQVLAVAAEAGCRRLILFHHDPERDDAAVDTLLADTRRRAAAVAPGIVVAAAREGDVHTLEREP